ncbi:Aldo/keto reductase [Alkalibacterium sp. AK22]|uniref:aldo/keto reductase n=1 Tax=Alkalibacterium sp. AK22 TaxID=1229520 RepID=UPI000452587A|nr:aldo/keto reductase [Alkalibacterium sp. AK22]EXJ23041.1 Aldo/keto reductase [Alkalibacterium sp. AK22]
MDKRKLGHSGLIVSAVGFGAWQLGNDRDWSGHTKAEAIALVHAAVEQGVTFFDTAPNYGSGNSERLLGEALQGKRDQVVISSKCGHQVDGVQSFEPEQLVHSVEGSLRRLKTDHLDSLLLHNPPFDSLNGYSPQFEVLKDLKKQGKIKAYGASVDSGREIDRIVDETASEVIEIMFNIFHQEPLLSMQRAEEQGVGLIAKVPLDSGWLSGKYHKNSSFTGIRSRWSQDIIERRSMLVEEVRHIIGPDTSMAEAAMHFILAYPCVSTVIPGVKSIQQLQENLSTADKKISEGVKTRLENLWKREIKDQPLPW